MAEIGMKIKILRISNGMRQDDLAEKLGLSKSSVSGWETGASEPSIHYVDRLCEVFHTTPNYLLGRGIDETIKLDEKEKRMLTVFKEQMPEKIRDVMLTISSYVHECYASEEDSRVIYGMFTEFINTYGLRKLWQKFRRHETEDDEFVIQRFHIRKKIREYIDTLLNDNFVTENDDIVAAEYELMEQDQNEHGERL